MDTIIGENGKGTILTLAERTTAFCMAQKLPKGKNAKELSKIVYAMLLPYKEHVHTITIDNGGEFLLADKPSYVKLLLSAKSFSVTFGLTQK